jgi:16S rRNA (guanine966-N2)-methyltransferase
MRVIAGQYRRRLLRSLPGTEIRPTADRLRETLFNVLCSGNPEALSGSVWIDMYAGTGAVGIEALSRGAKMVHFVESSKAAIELIAANLTSLGIARGFNIVGSDVLKGLRQLEKSGVMADFVFLDPPYRMADEYARSMKALAESRLLNPSVILIAEHDKKFVCGDAFDELHRYRTLAQGDAALSFYRRRV